MMICLSILSRTTEGMVESIRKGEPLVDMIECRLDKIQEPGLPRILGNSKKPLILTCRCREEGGYYAGSEKERLALLERALEMGPPYLDVELNTGRDAIERFVSKRGRSRIILSIHFMRNTPTEGELEEVLDRAIDLGADIVKVVTFSAQWEEVFRTLNLIPLAQQRGQSITAFCMGPLGKISRVISYMMGSFMTYVSLDGRRRLASGQLTLHQMHRLMRILR